MSSFETEHGAASALSPRPVEYHFRFEGIEKRFPTREPGGQANFDLPVIEDISFGISRGEVVSIIGPSGCGKSTLLSLGAGLNKPTAGKVWLGSRQISRPRPEIAFMLQKDLLLPWRTLVKNVEFGLEMRKQPAAQRRSRAMDLLRQCKLEKFWNFYPHQVSGGMRQRAALARTLAVNPEVLLLDEPLSALDAQTKVILRADLIRMIRMHRMTALLITHDIVEAISLSDRVLVMSHRPGRIIRELTIDLPHRDDPFLRSLEPQVGAYTAEIWELLKVKDDIN